MSPEVEGKKRPKRGETGASETGWSGGQRGISPSFVQFVLVGPGVNGLMCLRMAVAGPLRAVSPGHANGRFTWREPTPTKPLPPPDVCEYVMTR